MDDDEMVIIIKDLDILDLNTQKRGIYKWRLKYQILSSVT